MASIFWMDDELGSDIYLDGIVTVVDAKHCTKQLAEGENVASTVEENNEQSPSSVNAAVKQIALADIILLNKIDLINSPEEVAKVSSAVQNINSMAKLVHTEMSKIDINLVLDLHAYDGLDVIPEQFDTPAMTHLDSRVGTVTLYFDGATELSKVELFLQKLLWEKGEFKNMIHTDNCMDVMRLKANIVTMEGSEFLIQGVHDTYDCYKRKKRNDIGEGEVIGDSGQPGFNGCTFVLIGKYLDQHVLQKALLDYLA